MAKPLHRVLQCGGPHRANISKLRIPRYTRRVGNKRDDDNLEPREKNGERVVNFRGLEESRDVESERGGPVFGARTPDLPISRQWRRRWEIGVKSVLAPSGARLISYLRRGSSLATLENGERKMAAINDVLLLLLCLVCLVLHRLSGGFHKSIFY